MFNAVVSFDIAAKIRIRQYYVYKDKDSNIPKVIESNTKTQLRQ